ncbi:MAG: hypothetical protein ACRDOH_19175 [Streptosporangiaceae bacterium]
MLSGAGLALAEAPEADQPRLREEWGYLIRRSISGLQASNYPERPGVTPSGRLDPPAV